ncbi:MAG: toxin TcdB middle/N-terminal domain-containing protein, partial [Phycisphaerales bacterium]
MEDKKMSGTKSLRTCVAICVLTLAMRTSAHGQGASAGEQEVQLPRAFGEPRSVNVAPAFGAVSDSIPIVVPPGRRNVEPHLALTYSSQAGLGNAGLGWQLDTGCVTRWRGDGTPTVGDPGAFSYSLAGAGGELRDVGGGVYRARLESMYREFRRLGSQPDDGWEMSNGEGVLHRFGGTAESRIKDSGGRGQLWLLDLVQDRSGNTITYSYERVDNTLYPKEIRYTGFGPTGDPGANRIVFEYEGRPDERVSYNNTVREERTRRLQCISAFAGDSLTRRYDLEYEQSPVNGQSLLKRVKLVGADGASWITLRTLEYRSRTIGWNGVPLVGTIPVDLADEDGKETGARLVDVNGDGFADAVGNGTGVWLGDGQGNFNQDENDSWNTSLASAGVQFVEPSGDRRGVDKGVRLIDVNSDGLPDLFIAQSNPDPDPDRREVWLNTGNGWSPDDDPNWTASLESLKPHAAVDPCYSDLASVDFLDEDIINLPLFVEQLQDDLYAVSQFLWVGFVENTRQLISDFNEADPDHQELIDALVEELNEVIYGYPIYGQERFSEVDLSDATETLLEQDPPVDSPWLHRLHRLLLEDAYPQAISKRYTPPIYGELQEEYSDETFAIVEDDGVSKGVKLTDINGDGRIDILWSIDRSEVLYWGNQQIPIVLRAVFLNTGDGWVIDPSLTQELRYFPFVSDSQLPGYDVMDLNGDGLADIVRTFEDAQEAHLGTGRGWDKDPNTSASLRDNEIVSLAEVDDERKGQGLMPLDFDDDGLVDYLRANEIVTEAYHNTGTGWEKSETMAANLSSLGIAFNSADGDATGVTLADVDGDGLSDLLKAKQGERKIWLSSSLRSGLLVKATSALGEVTEVEWMPSTSFDNKVNGLERLPFSMPVTTKLTRGDGRGNAYETTYHYQGGVFEDRQFRGFRWSRQMRPGGLRAETCYHQEEGLAGWLDFEQGYDSQDQLRTMRSSEYETVTAGEGKVKQIQLIQTDQQVIDPDGTRHSRAIYAHDDRLNIVSVSRDPQVDVDGDETVTLFSWAHDDGAGIWSMPAGTQTLGPDGSVLSESIIL